MPKITREDLSRNFHLLRHAPEKYLAMAHELVRADPASADGYWCRATAYETIGKYDLALADLNKVLSFDKHWINYETRGNVLRALGRYQEALDDYNRAEAADPEEWKGGFGHLFRAECHARLGNEQAAMKDCAALHEDHWTPGLLGAPSGNKEQVAAELHRLARDARKPKLV
jgi:tetratricopeptide (TPR) repeat protein